MADGLGFRLDISGLVNGLSSFEDRVDEAVMMVADTGGQLLESSAKENARWQNRTGHARQRLRGGYYTLTNGYRLFLAHGVDYGKWLELAYEKRYSIIPQTINYVGAFEVMPMFERLIERLTSING